MKDSDLRSVLGPLAAMAERLNIAVIAIVHFTKDEQKSALMRVMNSVAMVAAARSCHVVVKDDIEKGRRLFLPIKGNLAPDDVGGLAYRIVMKATGLPTVPEAPAIEWEQGQINVSADEALNALRHKDDKRRSETAEVAAKIIAEMLKDGPRPAKEMEARLEELGISDSSQRTAKQKLQVKSQKKKGELKGPWLWMMPEHPDYPF